MSKGRRPRAGRIPPTLEDDTTLNTLYEKSFEDDDDAETDTLDASYLSYEDFTHGDETITFDSETIDTTTLGDTATSASDESTIIAIPGAPVFKNSQSTEEKLGGHRGGAIRKTSSFDEGSYSMETSTISTLHTDKFQNRLFFCGSTSGDEILRKMKREVKGAFQDTVASLSQVFHAFTLSEKDIRAVTRRIHKAKRQFGENN